VLSLDRQEHYRRRYAELTPRWRPSTHVYQDLVAARLGSRTRALDLGCGRGGVMERLHPRAAFVAGLDPDFASLREHRAPALFRACGVAECLPYADDCFDLVCCSWVLEHASAPRRTFAEVARVLQPGGAFIFLTPNARHPLLALNRALGWTRGRLAQKVYGREEADVFPALYRANTESQIRQLACSAGLTLRAFHFVGDPTYLAFNDLFFHLGCLLERITPPALRVHFIGECRLSI
jgi:SAM-dependent methyltransferase